jgi:hypothetical protein
MGVILGWGEGVAAGVAQGVVLTVGAEQAQTAACRAGGGEASSGGSSGAQEAAGSPGDLFEVGGELRVVGEGCVEVCFEEVGGCGEGGAFASSWRGGVPSSGGEKGCFVGQDGAEGVLL